MRKNPSFTLLELVIIIIIMGILATLSLNTYARQKEHTLGKEAIANLKLIGAAQRIYRLQF